jgi:hypothetical protein
VELSCSDDEKVPTQCKGLRTFPNVSVPSNVAVERFCETIVGMKVEEQEPESVQALEKERSGL